MDRCLVRLIHAQGLCGLNALGIHPQNKYVRVVGENLTGDPISHLTCGNSSDGCIKRDLPTTASDYTNPFECELDLYGTHIERTEYGRINIDPLPSSVKYIANEIQLEIINAPKDANKSNKWKFLRELVARRIASRSYIAWVNNNMACNSNGRNSKQEITPDDCRDCYFNQPNSRTGCSIINNRP